MLTDNDFKRLTEFFASKFDLKEAVQGLEERFDKKFQEVLTRLNAVFKEVKDMRQEQDIHVQQHLDINDDLDSIKNQIKTIPPTSV